MTDVPDAPPKGEFLYWPAKILSFEGLVAMLSALGATMIVLIMAMICTDVVSRYVFDHPIRGVAELTELFIVGIVFLQLPHAVRLGKLTRSDGAYGFLLGRIPWLGHTLGALYDLAGAALLSIIALGGLPKLASAWENGFYYGVVDVFTFPEWPVWVLLLIGSVVTAIQFVLFAIHHIRCAIANRPEGILPTSVASMLDGS